MNQLDKRVSKLEHVMGKRPPRLEGKSPQQCLELFLDACRSDPDRSELIVRGMSEEQLDAMFELMGQELAKRAEAPQAIK
jgi:hypothetical protein